MPRSCLQRMAGASPFVGVEDWLVKIALAMSEPGGGVAETDLDLPGVPRIGDTITLFAGPHSLSMNFLVDEVVWNPDKPYVWLGSTVVQDDLSECTWDEWWPLYAS